MDAKIHIVFTLPHTDVSIVSARTFGSPSLRARRKRMDVLVGVAYSAQQTPVAMPAYADHGGRRSLRSLDSPPCLTSATLLRFLRC